MTTVPVLSEQSILALRRDHERLRYQVESLRAILRAYQSQLGDKPTNLVELCAQETAERNVAYAALLGTWNAAEEIWCYDDAPTVTAIDHRQGTLYAEEGWKGLYQAMPSTDHGTIYVCVSLDCELPAEGCNECEET